MPDKNQELVVVMTKGADHELSSVAFTIANGGITSGFKVYAFLTSSAVDLVRRRAVDLTHVQPLDPLKALIDDFVRRGGTIWALRAKNREATRAKTSSRASPSSAPAPCTNASSPAPHP